MERATNRIRTDPCEARIDEMNDLLAIISVGVRFSCELCFLGLRVLWVRTGIVPPQQGCGSKGGIDEIRTPLETDDICVGQLC